MPRLDEFTLLSRTLEALDQLRRDHPEAVRHLTDTEAIRLAKDANRRGRREVKTNPRRR